MSLKFISPLADIEVFLKILVIGGLVILAAEIIFESNLRALDLFILGGWFSLIQRMNE